MHQERTQLVLPQLVYQSTATHAVTSSSISYSLFCYFFSFGILVHVYMHDRVQQSAIPVSRYSFTSDEVEQVMPPPHSVSVRVTQKLKMDLDGIIDSLRDRDDVINSLAVFFCSTYYNCLPERFQLLRMGQIIIRKKKHFWTVGGMSQKVVDRFG